MSKREFAIGKNIKKPAEVQYFPRYSLKRVNLAFHIIAKIEAGTTPDPRIKTAKKIAEALGVSLENLIKENHEYL